MLSGYFIWKFYHYYAGKYDYPRFFFEGLITEFGNELPDQFFPWGHIFEFGDNYRPVFSPGKPFSSQVKMPETGFIPQGSRF